VPPQASSNAGDIDLLYVALNSVALFFTLAIVFSIIFFTIRYRRGSKVDRSNPPVHNTKVEIAWTVIPLAIAMGLFVWATALYLSQRRMPKNALEIQVVGKQWMWKMQHPDGRWENNELHVPVGRPVRLTMTSEDVIHSFFVPAFRLKTDVNPGQYTYMWFKPTRVGSFHLFCAEFCGTLHAKMIGQVVVMEPAEYERWLAEGNQPETVAAQGERLFRRHGCSGCHSAGSSVRAPLLEGLFGRSRPVQIPRGGTALQDTPATTVVADHRYIHDAIVLPEKEIAAGYSAVMPTFKNRLTEEEIFQIITYIRTRGSLTGGTNAGGASGGGTGNGSRRTNGPLTAEDYEARTGFIPDNIKGLQRGGGANPAPGGAPGAGGAPGTHSGTNERMTR